MHLEPVCTVCNMLICGNNPWFNQLRCMVSDLGRVVVGGLGGSKLMNKWCGIIALWGCGIYWLLVQAQYE